MQQPAKPDETDAGIIGGDSEVFCALLDQGIDQMFRHADLTEASDQNG